MDADEVVGGYKAAYKRLTSSSDHTALLGWLENAALVLCERTRQPPGRGSIAEQLHECIERRFSEPISLKTLAPEFGVSAPYLGRVFRDRYGASFSSTLNERRIERARELLRHKSMTAKEIAHRVGFTDANYFSLVFKRITKQTVTEYISGV
jgi:two-component system response regulator YesN